MMRFVSCLVVLFVALCSVGSADAEFRFGLLAPAQHNHNHGQMIQMAKFQDAAVAVAEPAPSPFVQSATSAFSNVLATQAQAAAVRQSQQPQQVRGGCNF